MADSPKYDLLLRGGRVICPASGIDGIRDIAIRGGRIAAIAATILPSSSTEIIDVSGKLVLPGLIDTHAHVYQYVTGRFGLNPDMVGVRSGVTTVIDQGGPSCMTLPGFRSFIVEPAETQVYAFLSAYLVGGLEGHYYPNLYSPDGVDVDAAVTAANANKDIVRGIKGHAEIGGFARWGIKVLEMSAEIGRRAELPLYVHFGTLWGLPESGANGEDADTILVLWPTTSCAPATFWPIHSRAIPAASSTGRAKFIASFAPLSNTASRSMSATAAISRIALPAWRSPAGIVPHTLGADMHGYNTEVPAPAGTPEQHYDDENHPFRGQARFSLTQAMSSMMALGIPLEDVVPMVTSNSAQMLGLTDCLGALKPGFAADVSVLFDDRGRFILRDNENTEVIAERLLRPVFCLRAGKRFDADSPILPQAIAA